MIDTSNLSIENEKIFKEECYALSQKGIEPNICFIGLDSNNDIIQLRLKNIIYHSKDSFANSIQREVNRKKENDLISLGWECISPCGHFDIGNNNIHYEIWGKMIKS